MVGGRWSVVVVVVVVVVVDVDGVVVGLGQSILGQQFGKGIVSSATILHFCCFICCSTCGVVVGHLSHINNSRLEIMNVY